MVALLHDSPVADRLGPARGHLRLVGDGRRLDPVSGVLPVRSDRSDRSEVSVEAASSPRLRLIEGEAAPARPGMAAILAVAVVVFGLLGLVRLVQGGSAAAVADAPSAGSAVALSGPVVADGDRVIVVAPGDTLWSIATTVTGDGDPRPAVAALIEVNGGESLQIGQQIVIPGHLLD